jgi:NAD(P)-dependent dehydrogenase (short-subunit alcohol dehydrogenase family)
VDLGVRGKGYLIVGGSAGIGRAAASALAADGAAVVIAGRDRARAEETARALHGEHGAHVVGLAVDVTVPGEADRLVAEAAVALADHGGLRGAAVTTGLGRRGQHDLVSASDPDWQHTYEDVLLATVRVCRAVVPVLVAAGGGSVVTTSAYSIHSPKAHQFPYSALKSAVATLTKNLAKTYGHAGVRANCVCPGATETDVLAAMRLRFARERGWPVEEALERAMVEDWGMQVALRRAGTPREVGDVIAFLLSERASYLTGALVNVDGGTDF